MTEGNKLTRRGLTLAVSLLALATAMPATAMPATAAETAPSTLSMLEAMVASGVITQTQATSILKDAEARDAARAARGEPAPAPSADGTKRVTYVPEIVKQQLRDEIKGQVMAQAKAEKWAAPNTHPEWTERIRFKGDIRGRYEGDYYPNGNAPGSFEAVNFNAYNALSTPIDHGDLTALATKIPYYNVDQNRERFRLRARLGVEADLGDDFTTGMRIATGDGNSPVSTNQSLGGSGGNFSKYQIWLDRAFIHWDAVKDADKGLSVTIGRFDNPFFFTDLIWDDDVGFDGIAASGRYEVATGVTPFVTVGAFPVYNTDLNLSSTETTKVASRDKWLYGAQAGTTWKPAEDVNVKLAAAYYRYSNVEGQVEDCLYGQTTCASDASRPAFAQKGNTYMTLRHNIGDNTKADYQYYGLATPFHELALTARLDYDGFEPIRITTDGEYVRNLAFSKAKMLRYDLQNNFNGGGGYDGGGTGYLMRLTVGKPKLAERWDWSVNLAYKYLESDAVVDGLADSDFGMGGTNLKGTILGGSLALGKNVWTGLRWMSADSIAGQPFSVDTVQADITARF
ncbi:putative porin [Magnetospirillum fulvum]|uniref:Putative porin n=1 Tax=Magnetospirillum fulvum TaxID=1082 RepID=A0A1H6K0X3_MAGFU|nr:putative porin [Magnetospirillum fulvum]SEH65944.1 Putative porin [Magnetospirillum fulvum]